MQDKPTGAARQQFIAKMNHDMRSPLHSIMGIGELLAHTPLNSEQKKYVEALSSASDTLLSLINTLFSSPYLDMAADVTAPYPVTTSELPELHGRILLVDDYPPNRQIAKSILEKMGCVVEAARNGEEALACLAEKQYDVVLMDCQMPEMDGFEATAEIRKREKDAHTVIIAMTGDTLAGDRDRCLQAGMDDYISKPLRSAELGQLLQRHLVAA